MAHVGTRRNAECHRRPQEHHSPQAQRERQERQQPRADAVQCRVAPIGLDRVADIGLGEEVERKGSQDAASDEVSDVMLVRQDGRDADQREPQSESDVLDGGSVLPGFSVPLRELVADLDERAPTGQA